MALHAKVRSSASVNNGRVTIQDQRHPQMLQWPRVPRFDYHLREGPVERQDAL